jgi:WXXGXW repeat (2 copies)
MAAQRSHPNNLPHDRVSCFNAILHMMKTKIGLPAFALAALLFLGLPLASSPAYVAVSVGIAPPAIPIYEQPFCPAPGYIWTPGYWAYGDFGYYWIPGAWVLAPRVGFLWTPGYWGYRNGGYSFNQGYWGPTIGFYGGINYGFGYYGSGYYGGRWEGNHFRYNTAVSRVNTTVITNTYVNREVVRNNSGTRKSFNGPGGVQAKPTAKERAATKAEHIAPTSAQKSRVEAAKKDPGLRAKNNKGKPNADAVRSFEAKHNPKAAGGAAAAKSDRGTRQGSETNRAGAKNRAGEKTAKGRSAQETNGNSAFGRKQGDAASRTTGAQNSAHGKARSSEVQSSRGSKKAARNEEAASSHSRKATEPRHKEAPKAARAPREVHRAPTVERKPKSVSQRQQAAPRRQSAKPRQAAPSRGGPGPAQQQQGKKKKKKHGDDR